MNKFTISIALLCGSWLSSQAAVGYESVTVNMTGGQTVKIELSDGLRVSFDEESMLVTGGDKDMSLAKTDISSFSFNKSSSVPSLEDGGATVAFDGNDMRFTGLADGSAVCVWTPDGAAVSTHTVSGDFTLPLSALAPGAYIVTVNETSYKILVK